MNNINNSNNTNNGVHGYTTYMLFICKRESVAAPFPKQSGRIHQKFLVSCFNPNQAEYKERGF